MSAQEANVVEVLELPNAYAMVIWTCEENVGIDCHACDWVL